MLMRCGSGAKTISSLPSPAPPHRRNPSRRRSLRPCGAKKPTPPSEAQQQQQQGKGLISVVPKSLLLRAGVALFGLGFVDAGYSGDWSRIGVISKGTEESLKLAAYIVVPLCLALVFSASEETKS